MNNPPRREQPIAESVLNGMIVNMEQALNLLQQAQVLLRPKPSTMKVNTHALTALVRAKVDTATELLKQALLPW